MCPFLRFLLPEKGLKTRGSAWVLGGNVDPPAHCALGSMGINLGSSPLLQSRLLAQHPQGAGKQHLSVRAQGRRCEVGCSLCPKLEIPVLSGHMTHRPR